VPDLVHHPVAHCIHQLHESRFAPDALKDLGPARKDEHKFILAEPLGLGNSFATDNPTLPSNIEHACIQVQPSCGNIKGDRLKERCKTILD